MFTLQLLPVVALNVTPVILVKVSELVVLQYGGGNVERDVELNDTLGRRGIVLRGDECVLWWRVLGARL